MSLSTLNKPKQISFFDTDEKQLIDRFESDGFAVFQLEKQDFLEEIRTYIYETSKQILPGRELPPINDFFNDTHDFIPNKELNDFRVRLITSLSENKSIRPMLYRLARKQLDWTVGNELAMQRSCNLSIQLPGDDSALLPLHTDVWSGNSPYEVVFWLPLVDCYQTKSMYLLPREKSEAIIREFPLYAHLTAEELYQKIEPDIVWLNVPYGYGVIFTHALLHGNRVNEEPETRWTINARFKGLLTPYGTKDLGESFLPITIRSSTRIGFHYKKPTIK